MRNVEVGVVGSNPSGITDPLAQEFMGWSTYNYTIGNPIRLIDPNGKAPTGDYFDFKTGKKLGTDGVNDHLEYKITKENYQAITQTSGYSLLSNEDKKGWLSGMSIQNSVTYNHEYSYNQSPTRVSSGNSSSSSKVKLPNPQISPSQSSNNSMDVSTLVNTTDYLMDTGTGINKLTNHSPSNGMKGFSGGIGLALTIVDAGYIAEEIGKGIVEYQYEGNSELLISTAKETTYNLVEGAIVSRLLLSGNPLAMGTAVFYLCAKSMNQKPEGGISPESYQYWLNTRDIDNNNINLTPRN